MSIEEQIKFLEMIKSRPGLFNDVDIFSIEKIIGSIRLLKSNYQSNKNQNFYLLSMSRDEYKEFNLFKQFRLFQKKYEQDQISSENKDWPTGWVYL